MLRALVVHRHEADRALFRAVADDLDLGAAVEEAPSAAEACAMLSGDAPPQAIIVDVEDVDTDLSALLFAAARRGVEAYALVNDVHDRRAAWVRAQGPVRLVPRPDRISGIRLLLRIACGLTRPSAAPAAV
jgi:CheY-like chemotaxis protein